MKKFLLLGSFFVAAPVLLVFSIVFLLFVSFQKNNPNSSLTFMPPTKTVAYAAFPPSNNVFQDTISSEDARVEMLRQFFTHYGSPLVLYANTIVKTADKYNIDFRLLPAIAAQESNLCKKIPKDSYNCWGFGIYAGKVQRFEGYPEAIETVSKTLATHYVGKGLNTPQEIMSKYTPSSNGSWAFGVSQFMDQLQ